jgi:hypothetical protein
MPKTWVTDMNDASSTTRGVVQVALLLFVGGLLLPFATFVLLASFVDVPRTSTATISMAGGVGFAWFLALVVGVVGWRYAAGKVTAFGAVTLAGLAAVAVWQRFHQPTWELDGTWQAVRMELADGTSHNDMASVTRLTIAGLKVKYSGLVGDKYSGLLGEIEGLISIDATQNPKTFEAGGIRGAGYDAVKLD